ncbi:hypothetical protein L1987_17551 [Smallanthus sonchifolius]|uniref:Uncharacterized protein n=1 Tax=Smallanthus sonchifolius TaxID=185202 RepID=A0ACB9IY44_9ASTR|nr:hypothetical protein L1987_17551 [Smallanthus sonchifolius]
MIRYGDESERSVEGVVYIFDFLVILLKLLQANYIYQALASLLTYLLQSQASPGYQVVKVNNRSTEGFEAFSETNSSWKAW